MKPKRLHHVGIIIPDMEQAQKFLKQFGLEIDYFSYVKAYQSDIIFTRISEQPH